MRRTTAVAALAAAITAVVAVPASAATKTVKVADDYFVRDSGTPKVTVTAGDTVKWVWKGASVHDVSVAKGPAKFKSALKSSGNFTRKVTKAGTYSIVCTIHQPGMKMTLVVKPKKKK